jgi:hypothetical protein
MTSILNWFDFKRVRSFLTVGLVALLFSGCEKTDQTFTLNPDGSGKMVHVATFPLDVESPSFGNNDGPKSDAEKVAAAIKKILSKSEGVAVWKDVSCEATEAGLIKFVGTAYFKDFASFKPASLSGSTKSKGGPQLQFSPTDNGYRATIQFKKNEPKKPSGKTYEKPVTDEEKRKEIIRIRTTWQYTKHMMGMVVGNEVKSYTFVAPEATVVKSEQLEKTDDGYRFVFDGAKIFEAMDEMMGLPDEQLMGLLDQGINLKDGEEAMAYLAGKMGMDPREGVVFEVKTEQPQFDFGKEVAAAQVETIALMQKYGTRAGGGDAPAPEATAETASKGLIKASKVVSIRREFPTDESSRARIAVGLKAEFDGVVTSLGEGWVESIIGDSGENLLTAPKTLNGNLAGNRLAATFRVNVPVTEGGSRIKKMAGTLSYAVSTGGKETDLGPKIMRVV